MFLNVRGGQIMKDLGWQAEISALSLIEGESCSVLSDSSKPHRLHIPWNSPGQNTGVGNLSLLQGDLPNPGIEPRSPALQANYLPAEPQGNRM